LYTHYDARDSLRTQRPQFKDFGDLNLRVITHPSIESRALYTLGTEQIYKDWIEIQNRSINANMINLAMGHGMIENSTLHPDFLKGNYDYIALGDDHKMRKVTDHAWYSGSTELWSFSEFNTEKGYLMVDVEHGKAFPRVTPKKIQSSRKIVSENVEIFPQDTNSEIIRKVKSVLDSYGLNVRYDYSTAARVKIVLKGEKTYGDSFNIGEVESFLRKLALDSNDYNIVEFILDRPAYAEYTDVKYNLEDETECVEYLIEDPEKEFKDYVTTMRNEELRKQRLNPDLLAKIFAKVLSHHDDNGLEGCDNN
jgi:DNA repair exonuclease SbcCD nuclease subunit